VGVEIEKNCIFFSVEKRSWEIDRGSKSGLATLLYSS
jgi:hypothetical protein